MKNFFFVLLTVIVANIMIPTCFTEPASAADLWVVPQSTSDTKKLDDWYVNRAPAAFSLCTPGNMEAFEGAKILFIPYKSKDIEYELRLSVSKSGEHRNAFQYSVDAQIAENCEKDVITEIDVTEFLATCFSDMNMIPGEDCISLVFDPDQGNAKVIGMRFSYESSTEGLQGPVGPAGSQGEKGEKGDKGNTGDTGAIGPQGLQGEKGDIGEPGPQGAKGNKGDTGATGPQGEKGEKGDKGDTGDIGSQGIQGPQGVKGDTGAIGPQGPQGIKGDKGDTGATGPQGPAGVDGAIGPPGPPGIQGEQGPMGPQGEQGLEGPQGEPGVCDISREEFDDLMSRVEALEIGCAKGTASVSYDITSQSALNALSGYTRIEGDLVIKGSNITTLKGLECLERVDGALTIRETEITSLESLKWLQAVAGYVTIIYNSELCNSEVEVFIRELEEKTGYTYGANKNNCD